MLRLECVLDVRNLVISKAEAQPALTAEEFGHQLIGTRQTVRIVHEQVTTLVFSVGEENIMLMNLVLVVIKDSVEEQNILLQRDLIPGR